MGYHRDLVDRDLHAPSNEKVENNSASPIGRMIAVQFNGMGTNFMQIIPGDGTANVIRGMTQSYISNVVDINTGFITALGILTDVDTSAFSVNDFLYAGPSGVLQNTSYGPIIAQVLVVDALHGKIYVQIPNAGTPLDIRTKVSSTDTTTDFLIAKILAGYGISVVQENIGAAEDLKINVLTGTPVTLTPDQANAAGVATTLAKSDHMHNVPTAIAVDVGSANAQGSAATFSRADHVHKGVHSFHANATANRYGDLSLQPGSNVTITDDGSGNFTIATVNSGTVSSVGLTMPSIFSVANSPITGSGTFVVTLNTETAATVFAGPSSGSPAIPTFRALTSTDIPALSYVTSVGLSAPSIFTVTNSPVTSSGTLTFTLNTETAATVFAGPATGSPAVPTFRALAATDIPALAYVTSVGLSLPNIFNVTNSPVTSSGTLTATLVSQNANLFFASPNGSSGTPSFRSIVIADLPTGIPVTQNTDQANAAGAATTIAKSDHIHNIPTDVPVDIDGTDSQGTSTKFSKADHVHKGLHSIHANIGANRFGDVSLQQGSNVTITDDGSGNFTIATVNSGTVSSVGLSMPSIFTVTNSPVTGSGTLTVTLNTETAGTVFAGPATGVPAVPTFRALVSTDIPALAYVTSVGLSLPNIFNVTNSPVTGSGTLTATLVSQNANLVFASPSGSAGTPSFRSLTSTDIPALAYVTSVGLSAPAEFTVTVSPITSSGTLTFVKATQAANTIWAGPVSGAAAVPTFRTQVLADLPHLTDGQLYIGSTGNAVVAATLTAGTGVTITNAAGSITIAADNSTSVTDGLVYFDDFVSGSLDGVIEEPFGTMEKTANGSTSDIANNGVTGSGFCGVGTVATGTTYNSTGVGTINSFYDYGKIVVGSIRTVFEARVRVPTLSTSGVSFEVLEGYSITTANIPPTDGIYFYYTHGTNSGAWQCTCRAGSTSTNLNSTVTVNANQWYKLRLDVNAAGNSVTFYIDGVLVGSIATNIPTAALVIYHSIQKLNTTSTSRSFDVDFWYWKVIGR